MWDASPEIVNDDYILFIRFLGNVQSIEVNVSNFELPLSY